ncbi:MAG: hypothetical protein R3277_06640 [Brumimicrobium sp.]|nr:hypothetical protein [Brumimicrobium sp.]
MSDEVWEVDIPSDLQFLGHKGSGTIDELGNLGFMENSWPAVKNAFDRIDGCEVDLQLSRDSTLWVHHNHDVLNCDDSLVNFFDQTDLSIDQISQCVYGGQLIKLEALLNRIRKEDYLNKTLSLDLKVLYNPVTLETFGSEENLARFVAKLLKEMISDEQIDILIEVSSLSQYTIFRSMLKNEIFLINYHPSSAFLEESKRNRIDLSLPLSELPSSVNFKSRDEVQLWTINQPDEMLKALKLKPDYIQSDNVTMMEFFKEIQSGSTLHRVRLDTFQVKMDSDREFHSLGVYDADDIRALAKITLEVNTIPEECVLVLEAVDTREKTVHWEGKNIKDSGPIYFFIDPEYLKYKKAKIIKLYLWNKEHKVVDLVLTSEKFVL